MLPRNPSVPKPVGPRLLPLPQRLPLHCLHNETMSRHLTMTTTAGSVLSKENDNKLRYQNNKNKSHQRVLLNSCSKQHCFM